MVIFSAIWGLGTVIHGLFKPVMMFKQSFSLSGHCWVETGI